MATDGNLAGCLNVLLLFPFFMRKPTFLPLEVFVDRGYPSKADADADESESDEASALDMGDGPDAAEKSHFSEVCHLACWMFAEILFSSVLIRPWDSSPRVLDSKKSPWVHGMFCKALGSSLGCQSCFEAILLWSMALMPSMISVKCRRLQNVVVYVPT